MERQDLFRIGDVAKMFHLSVSILRHYEGIGLLAPEYVDPDSGYRYYGPGQFEALNTIRYLRALDMPLEQIREFLQNRELDVIEEKLRRQRESVVRKQQELAVIQRKIDNRLRQLQDARNSQLETVRLVELPPCRLVWIQDSLRPRTYLDLEYSIRRLEAGQAESVVFLGKVGVGIAREQLLAGRFDRYDLVFLLLDEEDRYQGAVEQLPRSAALSVRFCGGHQEAPAYYRRLCREIRDRGLEITGFSREVTLIDNGLTGDPAQFVTEISIPVAGTAAPGEPMTGSS